MAAVRHISLWGAHTAPHTSWLDLTAISWRVQKGDKKNEGKEEKAGYGRRGGLVPKRVCWSALPAMQLPQVSLDGHMLACYHYCTTQLHRSAYNAAAIILYVCRSVRHTCDLSKWLNGFS